VTARDLQNREATGAAVQAILDRVENISQSEKAVKKAEMDRLRRTAETVRSNLVAEGLIRSVSEATETSSAVQSLEPVASRDDAPRSEGAASHGIMPARLKTWASTSQMQAYRENA
jgi:hypothetical protein